MFYPFNYHSSWSQRILFIIFVLVFSLCLVPGLSSRRVSGQGICQVDCNAVVQNTAAVGVAASFAATATAPGCASTANYEWDFGDGSAHATIASTTHAYTAPGTYTWRMTARAANGATTIDTIAGGYGEGLEVNQAALTQPLAMARDPLGRGLYVYDQTSGSGLLRFINTSLAAVTLAGKTIAPGTSRALFDAPDANGLRTLDVAAVTGLVVSADGNLIFLANSNAAGNSFANFHSVFAFNVSSSQQTVLGTIVPPQQVLGLGYSQGAEAGTLAVHPQTGQLYVTAGKLVYKITAVGQWQVVAGNDATTFLQDPFSGGPAVSEPLLNPHGLAFDSAGNLYIADSGHARVIKVNGSGIATLVAQLPFDPFSPNHQANPYPAALAVRGGNVYVANGNQQVVMQLTGIVSPTIIAGASYLACDYGINQCGDGSALSAARFSLPQQSSTASFVALEADANGFFVLDQGDRWRGRVRYLNLSAQAVTLAGTTIAPNSAATIAGNGAKEPFDGPATGASLTDLSGVATDANGNLWIADTYRHTIRFVNRSQSPITLFAGTAAELIVQPGRMATINRNIPSNPTDNSPVSRAVFDTPQGLFVTPQGVFVSDTKGGPTKPFSRRRTGLIRFINTSQATVTFYPGSASPISIQPGFVRTIAGGIASDPADNDGFFALRTRFYAPSDVVLHPVTGDLYLTDVGSEAVRKINGNTGIVSRLNLPSSGAISQAQPYQYTGLGIDTSGRLYVAAFRSSSSSAPVEFQLLRETAVGAGTFTVMNTTPLTSSPRDVAVDASGNAYVTQSNPYSYLTNNERKILRIAANGTVSTVAGSVQGFDGDGGAATSARLALNPPDILIMQGFTLSDVSLKYSRASATSSIVLGNNGEIIFADSLNRRIRRIGPGETVCVKTGTITITGNGMQPTISQLAPNEAFVGRSFLLTVNGAGFAPSSQIQWNGSARPTTFVSNTQLTTTIPASDLTAVGTGQITVTNVALGGGVSNSLPLSVLQPILPSVTDLNPSTVVRASAGFRLQVFGANFTSNSVVRLNGQPRVTTYINTETLEADILASDLFRGGSVNISVAQPDGSLSGVIPLMIICPGLTINPLVLPMATAGVPYSGSLTGIGGMAPYTFTGSAIPPGLSVSSFGVVYGTPMIPGNFTFTVNVMDANSCMNTLSVALSVTCQPLMMTPSNPALLAATGTFYSQVFTVTGGRTPYTFAGNSLPPGLLLSGAGVLSGIPTVNGIFRFSVNATDANGCAIAANFILDVRCGATITPLNSSLPNSVLGILYHQTLGLVEGVIGTTFSLITGALPSGLSLSVNGELSGTPGQIGSFTFTVRAQTPANCIAERQYTLFVTGCSSVSLGPPNLPDAFQGIDYIQAINVRNGYPLYKLKVVSGTLPLGVSLNDFVPGVQYYLQGTPMQSGDFSFILSVLDSNDCYSEQSFTLRVKSLATAKIADPLVCLTTGGTVMVEASVTNPMASSQPASFTATPDQNLFAITNSCTTTVGVCTVDATMNKVNWSGTLAAGQTVTIRYNAQTGDGLLPNAQACVTSTASVGNSLPASVTACATINCPAGGPGVLAQSRSPLSDGKPGSVLLYNVYTSATDPTRQNTRLSLTNTHPSLPVVVHLFFVDGASCSVSDSLLCLTANQTANFLASDLDPGTTGYIVAVAVDGTGCPTNFNYLIGDEYVKFASGHAANLGAEAISAIAGGLPVCDSNSVTAQLNFDGVGYSPVPHVLAADNIQSRADGNDSLLILNRIGGNLATGASTLGTIFGLFYDDAEKSASFQIAAGACQFRSLISNSLPRITPRFEQFVPAGRTGWFKAWVPGLAGMTGAILNANANAGTSAGAFNQGHNLHALTLTSTATYTIPIFPPGC